MRIILIGASALAEATAEILLKRGHEVVVIERDKDRIDALAERLDCGFVHGDGTRPAILGEVSPESSDFLFCLTNHDQDNILASLVGRSLGFARVVTKIEDPEFDHICLELGLTDTIIPDQATARTLADMVAGQSMMELSTMIRGEVRFFSFVARADDAGPIAELDLPQPSKAICIYRDDDFVLPGEDTKLVAGDEVVLITHSKNLAKLAERWGEKGGARS